MKTTKSQLQTTYSSRGIPSFQIELVHNGLHKHRIIKGSDSYQVERKAALQAIAWDEIWSKRSAMDSQRASQGQAKDKAYNLTKEDQDLQEELKNLLHHALEIDDAILPGHSFPSYPFSTNLISDFPQINKLLAAFFFNWS